MEDEDNQAKHRNFLDELHSVPEMNIDVLFETNQYEISDYIRVHEKYRYHQVDADNDVIMLCDAWNEEQFNRIKNQALSRFDKETKTLKYSTYDQFNDNKQKPIKQYYDNVSQLDDVDNLLDSTYKNQKGQVFKLAVDFGVIIERVDGNAEAQTITYKYLLPIDANSERRVPLEIRSEQSISLYKQYLRTVVGTMQERTNTDTHEKIIAIFSVMFFIFQYPLGGAAIPSLKQHIKRREIYYVDCKVNLCFWTAYSFITMPNSKDKRWKDGSRIAEAKRIFHRVNGVEFRDNYQGFDFVNDIDNFINKEQVNVHMYTYSDSPPRYELLQNYIIDNKEKQFNILFINDGINAHIMYISDVEALTGFRYCNICHRQAFRIKDPNLQVSMRNHMKKCQINGGKIVKKVILEKFAKPFVPHILSNKTYKYLLANNLTHLFKPTQYYIIYDIETLEKKVNEKFGDCSQVIATLVPYAIASTVKSASGIHSFYYDIRTDDFLDKWLVQLFEEAKQVKKDNKYKDETIPQYFEVPVIGFNSAKFDTSLVFKNLKSKDWTISKYLGSTSIAKQIVVKHKQFGIQLRFVDFKIYTTHTRLKDCVRDFGGIYKKGKFPHEFINTNNYMEQLNKSEPFPIDAFDNQLRNKKLSELKYQEYLVEAAKFKTRWDYLKYYNISDTRILIEPIDFLINLMFKYKVDMLTNISMAQCANAIKYAMCYNGFDINGNYNYESTDKSIDITQCYWKSKVESYIEQDSKKGRDSSNNDSIDDYYYFKDIFKNQRCHICNARFTWKNRPTLDRINNKLGHSKSNVIPCCLYCNTYKANRDENSMKLLIQLRKYAIFKQLPMTLISDEGYQLLRKGITGGISNVMHRYNIAGETRINHFQYDKEKQFNILFINDGINAHIMYISDVEALIGFRYCNICHRQAF
ncbi:MAG: hypothetical protein EZS28_033871, partial [Streblomastix strix]